jgi:transcriptional regulator with XRE-family HTH domain
MKIVGGVYMDYAKTGELIACLRKEKRLTQKELADKLGITDRAISKWERGLGCPDISLLDDLSKILDISILEILKGRRLDKDEIVNNESIIESMNYSKENIKYKLKRYFNIVSITLIIIISSLLVVYNLKSIYYLNRTYHAFLDNSDKNLFNEIHNDIKTIKDNQGIYSGEDYKKVLDFVNGLEKHLQTQRSSYYLYKKDYTFPEIAEFYKIHHVYMYNKFLSENNKEIYKIVHKYNQDVIDDIVTYYRFGSLLMEYDSTLSEQLRNPYYNDKTVNSEFATIIQGTISFENHRNNMLLKDIIKAGGIHE